jgi:hypothetical protein
MFSSVLFSFTTKSFGLFLVHADNTHEKKIFKLVGVGGLLRFINTQNRALRAPPTAPAHFYTSASLCLFLQL